MTENIGIAIAIAGYVILAVATLFDKFLVTKTFKQPLSYAFWLGLISLGAFILLPIDFKVPATLGDWILDLAAGACFTFSILFYMRGLYNTDASAALPTVGVLSTIFTGTLAYFLIGERLAVSQIASLFFLLGGFWILSSSQVGFRKKVIFDFLASAIFFALANVSMKVVLTTQPFISGLAFSRLGAAAVSIGMLTLPSLRSQILESKKVLNKKNILLTLFGNGLGALGMLGVFFAYQFTSPTVLNAMQGIQYGSLFILAWVVSRLWPTLIQEKIDDETLLKKFGGIALVTIGLAMLAGV